MTTWLALMSALTPRQREVLCLVDAGYTAKDIAQRLGCEQATVKRHTYDAHCHFPQLTVKELARAVAHMAGQDAAYAFFRRCLRLSRRTTAGKCTDRPSRCTCSSPIHTPLRGRRCPKCLRPSPRPRPRR